MVTALNAFPVAEVFDGPDTIDGTAYAVPRKTGKGTTVSLTIASPDADPGAFNFLVEVSIDGENFATFDNIINETDTTLPVLAEYADFGYAFIRVGQGTKDNDVVTTVQLIAV